MNRLDDRIVADSLHHDIRRPWLTRLSSKFQWGACAVSGRLQSDLCVSTKIKRTSGPVVPIMSYYFAGWFQVLEKWLLRLAHWTGCLRLESALTADVIVAVGTDQHVGQELHANWASVLHLTTVFKRSRAPFRRLQIVRLLDLL